MMKAYKATYYLDNQVVEEIILWTNSKKQAETLAMGYMVDLNAMNKVEVAETKSKIAIGLMNIIKENNCEEQLLKDEIDDINSRRSRFGLEPIELKDEGE